MTVDHDSLSVRSVNGSTAPLPTPVVAIATCECGARATVHDDNHVMLWWRAHQTDPAVPAAVWAERLELPASR